MKATSKLTLYGLLMLGWLCQTLGGLDWNIGIAAWLAPLFLLYYSRQCKWTGILLLYAGMAVSAALSKTAENVAGLFFLYVTTGLVHGVVTTLPYVLDKLLFKGEKRFYHTLIFPASLVLVEYLLSLALGIWGHSSLAFYQNFTLLQVLSLFGVFGISFLTGWFASLIRWILEQGLDVQRLKRAVFVYGLVFVAVLLYGDIRTRFFAPRGETVKVAAVSGEADIQQIFWDWEEEIMELSRNPGGTIPGEVYSSRADLESMVAKTRKALECGAKIVVWNEISLLVNQEQAGAVQAQVRDLCMTHQAYVLMAYLEENSTALSKPFNNASLLLTPSGKVGWRYMKSALSPMEPLVINAGDFTLPSLDTEYGRISNALCSDADLTRLMNQLGKIRVDILLVPAFDWEAITPYHSHMAAYTALRYGVSVVRSNGAGIVAFYDWQGRSLGETNTFVSDSEVNFAEIPVQGTRTLYARTGDLFVYLGILFLAFITGQTLLQRKRT